MVPRRKSFHDPDGSVYTLGCRVLRRVTELGARRLRTFLSSSIAAELTGEALLPRTVELNATESGELSAAFSSDPAPGAVWFEHEHIQFQSYAHEWVPEMLLDAADLTLSLARRLHDGGWDLKDASAGNVLFSGARPVFVDFCSIVERRLDEPYWWPKGQFERHFILPLLTFAYRGVSPAAMHLSYPDGLRHEDAFRLLACEKWLHPIAIRHCTLPALLARGRQGAEVSGRATTADPETSRVAQGWQMSSLATSLERIRKVLPRPQSRWQSYSDDRPQYSAEQLGAKRRIVGRWLSELAPRSVVDLGSNTGEFIAMAGTRGAFVVAIEGDLAAARVAYRRVRDENLRAVVLLQNVASPSPALGWRYSEKLSLHQRLDGSFDCVMALALLHHLVATAGIPPDEVVDQLSRWTTRTLIIEYVAPTDPMFLLLTRQRRIDHTWLTQDHFVGLLRRRFKIVSAEDVVPGLRTLLLCERLA